MRPRYFTRAKRPRADDGFWSNDISRPSTLEVCDHEPTDTGLLDANGDTIWRGPNPMGFLWDE